MKRPNIVVFFTDQQRHDTCGVYGQSLPTTPRLDAFAQDATVFDNAYTCQPVCGPARAAIQSGVYPTRLGCFRNAIALPQGIPTIASELNHAGYKTAYVGKWHLASTEGEFNYETTAVPEELRGGYKDYWAASDVLEFTSHGYDGYMFDKDGNRLDFKGYRPDCITDYALDFLQQQDDEQPFFLFLSHIEPHHQNDHKRYEGPVGSKERFADFEAPCDLIDAGGDWKEQYPDYLGCVERLDYNFGRVLDTLKENGLLENTVVFFTSDHGSHFRTRNPEYKRSCHDASIHIPFVVGAGAATDPRVRHAFSGGQRSEAIVSLIDLPATILACAGVDAPNFDGYDMAKEVAGEISREGAFLQISEDHVGRAIRTRKYTYEAWSDSADAWNDSAAPVYKDHCLYDNEVDPCQRHNLVADDGSVPVEYLDDLKHLRQLLLDQIEKIEGVRPVIL